MSDVSHQQDSVRLFAFPAPLVANRLPGFAHAGEFVGLEEVAQDQPSCR
jgi:hypothetical protein